MKINANNEVGIKNLLKVNKNDVKEKSDSSKTKSSDTDSVSFSDDLKKAEEKVIDILNYPDKRSEKVEKLKEMIKSGKYNVDIHKLTDKIIDDLIYGKFYR